MFRKHIKRATIFDNGDYSLHVTLHPVCSPLDGHTLIITSQKRESRNPHEEQVRFMACLDREGLINLVDLIQDKLNAESLITQVEASS